MDLQQLLWRCKYGDFLEHASKRKQQATETARTRNSRSTLLSGQQGAAIISLNVASFTSAPNENAYLDVFPCCCWPTYSFLLPSMERGELKPNLREQKTVAVDWLGGCCETTGSAMANLEKGSQGLLQVSGWSSC